MTTPNSLRTIDIQTFGNGDFWQLKIINRFCVTSVYNICKATYLFYLGQFQECLDILPQYSAHLDILFTSKTLELKCYYELQSELLPFKLDAHKMYLHRTSTKILSDAKRQMHLDFLNLLIQLSHSIPGDKKRSEKMLARIREKNRSVEWLWLMDKAEELKKSKKPTENK